ncbi:MAG TPA: bifunctional UDP-sugar hydrolase/5'-nucleotidase [Acidimicrobiia bacterium]|jgi:5'-nucleotidase|nr:bifunctional UDP-sugar hydrolase/5'-nucleotidase [Acidimicrobiia bacterium]
MSTTDSRFGLRLLAGLAAIALLVTTFLTGEADATWKADKDETCKPFTLTVLHNNDGESALMPSDTTPEEAGVARFATLVEKAKKEALARPKDRDRRQNTRGVIFLSSGDNFLASPAFSAGTETGTLYDALAVRLMEYDAVAIGNHEFDFGPDVLAQFIQQAKRPPFLSANLDLSGEPALAELASGRNPRIAASVVIKERGERIGVIGATTELLPFISSPRNVVVNEVLAAILAEIEKLEDQRVNKIILISHLQTIQEDLSLAPELSGVDIMIAGGGDELLANPDDLLLPSAVEEGIEPFGPYPMTATDADGVTVPIVTTPGQYSYLGQLVADFDCEGNIIAIDEEASGPRRVVSKVFPDGVRGDRQIQRRVVDPVEEFVSDLAATVIAQSEVDLDGLRESVRTRESNEGNLIADSLLWQAQQLAGGFGVDSPQIALQNGGGIRNDSIIPAGNVTELNTFQMVPFPNFVSVVPNIPRDQFKEILENAVSRVEQVDGRFAQVAGFSFTWDPNGTPQVLNDDGTVLTPGTRVRDVTLDDGTQIVVGGVVQSGDPIDIATIDFNARGGDQYPYRGAAFTTLGVSYQQAVSNFIQDPTGLNGVISAADYPEGGEGRITRVTTP